MDQGFGGVLAPAMLIALTPATRIFVAVAPVDLRRSFDGLAARVQEVLQQQLCAWWDWRTATGQFKDMAARTLLAKLARRGWIGLPERRGPSPNRHRLLSPPPRSWPTEPIVGSLSEWGRRRIGRGQFLFVGKGRSAGGTGPVPLSGLAPAGGGKPAIPGARGPRRTGGGVIFWRRRVEMPGTRPVDRMDCRTAGSPVGWIANNQRFLIAPWVRARYLASHLLGEVARRIGADWRQKYGHPIVMLESFVERDRFAGTCYHAANWQRLGSTRGRQDRDHDLRVPVKQVYAYPSLNNNQPQAHAVLARPSHGRQRRDWS